MNEEKKEQWRNIPCDNEKINCVCEYDAATCNDTTPGLYAHHFFGK